eukprot:ANDGO_02216.mRNA.1 hypothetical protein
MMEELLGMSRFWDRVEFQGRASVHLHGIGLIENAPKVDELTEALFRLRHDPQALKVNLSAVQNCLREFVDIVGITGMHPDPSRSRATGGPAPPPDCLEVDFLSIPEGEEETHYVHVVNKVLWHECTDYCKKAGRCRSKFPKSPSAETKITFDKWLQPRVEYRRNPGGERVVSHIRILARCLMCNICIELPLDRRKVENYVVAYITKREIRTKRMKDLSSDLLNSTNPNAPVSTLYRRIFLAASNREIGNQEAAYHTLGLPLSHCSEQFISFSLSRYVSLPGENDGEENDLSLRTTAESYETRDVSCSKLSFYESLRQYFLDGRKRQHFVIPVDKYWTYGYYPEQTENHERWCEKTLLLHFPWPSGGREAFTPRVVSEACSSFAEAFEAFLDSEYCPLMLKIQVMQDKRWQILKTEGIGDDDSESEVDDEDTLQPPELMVDRDAIREFSIFGGSDFRPGLEVLEDCPGYDVDDDGDDEDTTLDYSLACFTSSRILQHL